MASDVSYVHTLRGLLLIMGRYGIFMQDNAEPHTPYCQFDWPDRSLDMNLIEYFLDKLRRQIEMHTKV